MEVVPQLKYLGMDIICDRPKLIKAVKNRCKKLLGYVKGKIHVKCPDLKQIVLASFYRSALVYFLTPLMAAGAITKQEISDFEAHLTRKQLLIPSNVSNTVL